MPQISPSTLAAFEGLSEPEQRAALGRMSDVAKQSLLGAIKVKQGVSRVVDPAKNLVASPDPESTIGTRAREAAIGVLSPFTLPALADTAMSVGKTAADLISVNPLKGVGELKDLASGMFHSAVDPVANYIHAARAGDWDAAAGASGAILSQTVPAVSGVVETVKGAVPSVGKLRETARSAAQSATGAGAAKTTVPIVEDFNKAKLAEATTKAAQRDTHIDAVKNTLESNRDAVKTASRVEGVGRSIEEGGKELGSRVKNLDSLLREEANGKYQSVRDAVKDDPGVDLTELAKAAVHAENNILKGSSENIKQFRELARKAPEDEGVVTGGVTFPPGSNLFETLKAQGALEGGGTIPFDELQGYSSEIGRKLAQGNLPGDIYQALKYLKEKIDTAKATIADRNGAGAVLRNADSFWRDYMDLFYDKDSSIAKVRESVGVKNPQEAVNEFFRGNADEPAIGKLKKLKSVYAKDAAGVADLARNLKAARGEVQATTVPKSQAIPEVPKPPKAPEVPTAEDIVAAKRSKVQQKGQSLTELSKRDVYTVAGPLAAGVVGHNPLAGLISGIALEAGVKGLGHALTRPAVIEWIAKPTAADLAAIEKLPEAARGQLRTNLKKMIAEETKAGGKPQVSSAVQRLLSAGAAASGGVKSRRDALEILGQPTP